MGKIALGLGGPLVAGLSVFVLEKVFWSAPNNLPTDTILEKNKVNLVLPETSASVTDGAVEGVAEDPSLIPEGTVLLMTNDLSIDRKKTSKNGPFTWTLSDLKQGSMALLGPKQATLLDINHYDLVNHLSESELFMYRVPNFDDDRLIKGNYFIERLAYDDNNQLIQWQEKSNQPGEASFSTSNTDGVVLLLDHQYGNPKPLNITHWTFGSKEDCYFNDPCDTKNILIQDDEVSFSVYLSTKKLDLSVIVHDDSHIKMTSKKDKYEQKSLHFIGPNKSDVKEIEDLVQTIKANEQSYMVVLLGETMIKVPISSVVMNTQYYFIPDDSNSSIGSYKTAQEMNAIHNDSKDVITSIDDIEISFSFPLSDVVSNDHEKALKTMHKDEDTPLSITFVY